MKFKWRHFSQYCGELCGLAIISIIIFHYFSGAEKLAESDASCMTIHCFPSGQADAEYTGISH